MIVIPGALTFLVSHAIKHPVLEIWHEQEAHVLKLQ